MFYSDFHMFCFNFLLLFLLLFHYNESVEWKLAFHHVQVCRNVSLIFHWNKKKKVFSFFQHIFLIHSLSLSVSLSEEFIVISLLSLQGSFSVFLVQFNKTIKRNHIKKLSTYVSLMFFFFFFFVNYYWFCYSSHWHWCWKKERKERKMISPFAKFLLLFFNVYCLFFPFQIQSKLIIHFGHHHLMD